MKSVNISQLSRRRKPKALLQNKIIKMMITMNSNLKTALSVVKKVLRMYKAPTIVKKKINKIVMKIQISRKNLFSPHLTIITISHKEKT